jgi:hypothetical protein
MTNSYGRRTGIPSSKTAIERQIAATDKQIGVLAYELCGLTKEEIRIAEIGPK